MLFASSIVEQMVGGHSAKHPSQVGSHSSLDGAVMALSTHHLGSKLRSDLELFFRNLILRSCNWQYGDVEEQTMVFRVVQNAINYRQVSIIPSTGMHAIFNKIIAFAFSCFPDYSRSRLDESRRMQQLHHSKSEQASLPKAFGVWNVFHVASDA